MELRRALVEQAPSLALQRAAYDEICKLDQDLLAIALELQTLRNSLLTVEIRRKDDGS